MLPPLQTKANDSNSVLILLEVILCIALVSLLVEILLVIIMVNVATPMV